jgi:serine/threonine protein kinase
MGLVFVAEQQQPVRRKVALKVIKPGMDTRQVIARFEAERQALALMDHPHIARVFDGGVTSSERPYFVMELVKGVPLTEYCDQNQLALGARLELFLQVCAAVQHAHQKGIIHRDLKPSNVLVLSHDGTPVVKVIDFGVAKAIGQQLTDKTLYTQVDQLIGTPLYMSPEQAGQSSLDVDTRSDIYALGVLLYELLTGTTPFDKERLREADYDEMRRIIREEEPPRPSTRVSEQSRSVNPRRTPHRGSPDAPAGPTAVAATTVSEKRQSDPRKLSRLFRGELDWIVMKALEKDRNRRYESASAFAADVVRYLNHEAVQACPPSALYRLRKFVRRYRVWLALATLAATMLLLAAVGLAVSNRLITRQRDEAQAQRRLARSAVDKMFTQVAEKWLAQQPRLEPLQREFLEEALRFYQRFAEEPSADPELRLEAGTAYLRVAEIQKKLGDCGRAEESFNRAIGLLEQLVADYPHEPRYRAELGESRLRFGHLLNVLDRPAEAEQQYRKSVVLREKIVADFPDAAGFRQGLSVSLAGLANLQLYCGQAREAVKSYRQALSLFDQLPPDLANTGPSRLCQAHCRLVLGWALAADGATGEALEFGRQAVALAETLVQGSPDEPNYRSQLGQSLWWLACQLPKDRSAEAETMFRRALAIEQKLVTDFPAVPGYKVEVVRCYDGLGDRLFAAGRAREAEEAFGEVLKLSDQLLAEFPPAPAYCVALFDVRVKVGTMLYRAGRFPEAESLCRRTLPMAERLAAAFPSNHRLRHYVALTHYRTGKVVCEVGRFREAEKACRRALEVWSELAVQYPATYRHWCAEAQNELAHLLSTSPVDRCRDTAKAVQWARRAVELKPQEARFWSTLGAAHYRAEDWGAAVAALEKARKMHTGGVSYFGFYLAMAQWRLGHKTEARQLYEQAVAWRKANQQALENDRPVSARFDRFQAEAEGLLGIRSPLLGGKQIN